MKRHTPEKHTEKTKLKISLALKGKKKSKETRERMRKAQTGHKLSEKGKQKVREAMMGERNHNWLGGISFEPYSVDWTKTLKKSIRERDRYICQICGIEPAVHIHHIDYDKKNCDPNNLITLCRRCHAKTNSNRKYWINYFNNGRRFG